MSVSKRLRYEILRRDNHACRYCGGVAPDAVLTVDHVIPVTLGGSDEPSNLVAACRDCNAGKSASSPDAPLVEDVAADAVRWANARQVAADAMTAEVELARHTRTVFDNAWRDWRGLNDSEIMRPQDWAASVDHWLAAGLPMAALLDSIDIAMRKEIRADQTWRYFCGIVWRRLSQLQQATIDVLATDAPAALPPGFFGQASP